MVLWLGVWLPERWVAVGGGHCATGFLVCCLCGGTEPEAAVTGGYWATG